MLHSFFGCSGPIHFVNSAANILPMEAKIFGRNSAAIR
jgi:hypothetical protein